MLYLHKSFCISMVFALLFLLLNIANFLTATDLHYKFVSAVPLLVLVLISNISIDTGGKKSEYFFNRIAWFLILSILIFELYNKTHTAIMLFLLHLYFRDKIYFALSMVAMAYVEAKVPLGCMGLLVMHTLIVQRRILASLFFSAFIMFIIYNIIGHWFRYELSDIWTIQNRLNSYDYLLNYLTTGNYNYWFGSDPALHSVEAFDAGIVVGIVGLGLPLFACYMMIVFLILKRQLGSKVPASVSMLPFITQAYLLQPVVVMFFILLVTYNRRRI